MVVQSVPSPKACARVLCTFYRRFVESGRSIRAYSKAQGVCGLLSSCWPSLVEGVQLSARISYRMVEYGRSFQRHKEAHKSLLDFIRPCIQHRIVEYGSSVNKSINSRFHTSIQEPYFMMLILEYGRSAEAREVCSFSYPTSMQNAASHQEEHGRSVRDLNKEQKSTRIHACIIHQRVKCVNDNSSSRAGIYTQHVSEEKRKVYAYHIHSKQCHVSDLP